MKFRQFLFLAAFPGCISTAALAQQPFPGSPGQQPSPPAVTAQAPQQNRLMPPGTVAGETRSEMPPSKQAAEEAKQPITLEMRADILMARKMYREAIETYRKAPQDSPVVMNKIGIAYHQLVDLYTAKKFYEKAAKLKPDYAEAINNLGTVHYAQKSYRKAINYYKRALKASPNAASIHSNLGTAYFARKNYELALAEYEVAMKLDPDVFEHRGSHGVLLQERSVEERAKFHYYLAKSYAKAGNNERALLYLRKALEEGLKERKKVVEEPDFANIRELPEFKQILAMEYRVL
jgi:tetratricopeptide (TPR) repeat protein